MTEPALTLRETLTQSLDEAEWDWLIPHVQRDAVIMVTPGLDLVEVGEAIATDNAIAVDRWISEALIFKPSSEQLGHWNQNQQTRFQSLIVQPYVLIQELASPNSGRLS
jgi:hypothetical protein